MLMTMYWTIQYTLYLCKDHQQQQHLPEKDLNLKSLKLPTTGTIPYMDFLMISWRVRRCNAAHKDLKCSLKDLTLLIYHIGYSLS